MTIAVMSTTRTSRIFLNTVSTWIQWTKIKSCSIRNWYYCLYFLGYLYSEERVVRDGNLVTSRGPGTAFEFGIELVRAVRGDDGQADKLAGPMLLKWFHAGQTMDRCFDKGIASFQNSSVGVCYESIGDWSFVSSSIVHPISGCQLCLPSPRKSFRPWYYVKLIAEKVNTLTVESFVNLNL